MDELKNQRTSGDNARATGEEITTDDILQDAALSAALTSEDTYLGQVDLGCG